MDKKLTWVEVVLLIACFAATFVVIGAVFLRLTADYPKDRVGDLATWFGAVGTMTAVLSAYLLGERQAEAAGKQERAREARQQQALFDRIFAVLEACRAALEPLSSEYQLDQRHKFAVALVYDKRIFDSLGQALTGFNLADLRSPTGIKHMLEAQRTFIDIQRSIENFLGRQIPNHVAFYGGVSRPDEHLYVENNRKWFTVAHQKLREEFLD